MKTNGQKIIMIYILFVLASISPKSGVFAQKISAEPSFSFFNNHSVVIRTFSTRILTIGGINRRILRNMIRSGFMEITSTDSFETAAKKLFTPEDIIGFKFNSYNADMLDTNTAIAEELLRLFYAAGFNPKQMIFIGAEPQDPNLPKTRAVKFGWGEIRDFGSGKDRFAKVLYEVTAIVNVGTIMADPIGAINDCMKNVTFGFIKHPARYYKNGYLPYIVDIYSLPEIRNKIRINILSGIRILLRREHFNSSNAILNYRSLFFSRDIVAIDATGFEVLVRMRRKKRLPKLLAGRDFPPYLIAAFQRNIGLYHPDQVDLKLINVN